MAQIKLYDKGGNQLLTIDDSKEINRGGEGAIYQHPNDKNLVVKIYHQGVTTSLNISFMEELKKLGPEFVKPLEIYYEKNGKTVKGFSMRYLKTAKMFLLSTLTSKALCQKEGFNEGFRKRILQKIRESLIAAHSAKVQIGDLNPYNIYFDAKGEVYFIDADSYQTPSKKHSDVILPEVRDWFSIGVTESSDHYAYAVLAFQSSTFLHPFKGIHKKYKTLEERSTKLISVLSGDKDLTIPVFYEPLPGPLEKIFYSIFQDRQRFLVDLSTANIVTKHVTVATYTDKDVTIRLISSNSGDFGSCLTHFYYTEDNQAILMSSPSKQVITAFGKVRKPELLLCSSNGFVAFDNGSCCIIKQGGTEPISNVSYRPDDILIKCSENIAVTFSDYSDSYMIYNFASIMSGRVDSGSGSVFVPSVEPSYNCCVQNVVGMKWLLNFDAGYLQTVRTSHNIKTALHSSDIYMLEIWQNGVQKFFMAKKTGLEIDLGEEFDSWRSLVRIADNVMVVADKKILVYSAIGMQKIAEIDCSVVTEQSVIKFCNAGILCQTGSNLYLINKN